MHVPADHHGHPAEVGVEDGVVPAGGDAAVDLLARQANLAVLADELPIPAQQDAGVVDGLAVPLVQAGHHVEPVPGRQPGQEACRGARDRLGHLGVAPAGADDGDALGQADDVGLLPGGLLDQPGELVQVFLGRLGAARPMVDGGQAHLACRRGSTFRQVGVAPDDLAVGGPAQMQFEPRLGRLVGSPVGAGQRGPAIPARVRTGQGVFRRPELLALGVEPEDLRQDAAGRGSDVPARYSARKA